MKTENSLKHIRANTINLKTGMHDLFNLSFPLHMIPHLPGRCEKI